MGLLDGYPGLGGGGGGIDLNQLVRPPDPLGAALGQISQRLATAGQASRLPVSTLGALGSALGGASTAAQAVQGQYLDQAIKLQALKRSLQQMGYDEQTATYLAGIRARQLARGAGGAPAASMALGVPGAAPGVPGAASGVPGAAPGVPGAAPGVPPVVPIARPIGSVGDQGAASAAGEYGEGQAPAVAPALPSPEFAGFTPSPLPLGSPGTVTIDGKTYTRTGPLKTTGLLGDPTQGGPEAGATPASFRLASLVGPADGRAGDGAGSDLDLTGLLAPDREGVKDPLAGLLATDATIQPGGPDTLVRSGDQSQLPVDLASMGVPSSGDPRNNVPYIAQAAKERGIDPNVAVAVARSEGLGTFLGDGGKSGGAFQLYTGGGVGNEFKRDTGLDPLDPKNEKATIDYALDYAKQNGWGAWNGAKQIGVTGYTGIGSEGGGARPGMMLAQYAPGGGPSAAAIADPAAVINGLLQQRAPGAGGGVIPGLDMTPQEVAMLNAMSALGGHANSPFKEFLDIYYKDPQYLQDAARAGQLGKAQVDLQYGPLTAGLTARAQAAGQQPYELEKIFTKSRADLEANWDKPERITFTDAQGNPHETFISPRQMAGGADSSILGKGTPGIAAPTGPLSGPQTGLGDVGKARVELDKGMAQSAATTAATGQQLAPILDEIIRIADKTPQGMAGPIGATMAARLSPFFPVSESLTNAELMRSLTQQLIPTVRQPGAQSNKEMEVYQLAVPGLMQSAIGRAQIANINKAMINRASDIAAIRRDNIGAPDLSQKLAELDNKPLFSDQQRAIMQAGTGRPIDKAAYDLLPPGMLYTDPMGTKRAKPAAP